MEFSCNSRADNSENNFRISPKIDLAEILWSLIFGIKIIILEQEMKAPEWQQCEISFFFVVRGHFLISSKIILAEILWSYIFCKKIILVQDINSLEWYQGELAIFVIQGQITAELLPKSNLAKILYCGHTNHI